MRRDRPDIIRDILTAIREGKNKKTKIMYQAGLSYKQLEEYLPSIENAHLINHDENNGGRFRVTEKGKKFIETYNLLNVLMS